MTAHDPIRSVVITGAASGIGKATALAFARQGPTRLMLASRRHAELEATAQACRELGSVAATKVADVADEGEVSMLADEAVAAFGRIDVWFNNAGVDAFGRFEDIPAEVFERVMRTNFMGVVHGARAVLPHFRHQGAGVLINNASIVGVCPSPLHSPYVASKFAIRGFSLALRQELVDAPGIHVCLVLPSSIDTPLWQRSANYTGHKIKPLDPVHPVEQVAETVLELARSPRREVFAGATGWMLAEQHRAQAEPTEALLAAAAPAMLLQDEPAPAGPGAVLAPDQGNGGASGGWRSQRSPAVKGGDVYALIGAPALLALPALYGAQLTGNLWREFGSQILHAMRTEPPGARAQ
jgi:short-subunit dehydrogenase